MLRAAASRSGACGVARLHGERGVERGRGLVAQPAQHPGAAARCGLGSVEHGAHFMQGMGRPHGARRTKRMAQAGTGRIMRVGLLMQGKTANYRDMARWIMAK